MSKALLIAALSRALPILVGALGAWVLAQWPAGHTAFCSGVF